MFFLIVWNVICTCVSEKRYRRSIKKKKGKQSMANEQKVKRRWKTVRQPNVTPLLLLWLVKFPKQKAVFSLIFATDKIRNCCLKSTLLRPRYLITFFNYHDNKKCENFVKSTAWTVGEKGYDWFKLRVPLPEVFSENMTMPICAMEIQMVVHIFSGFA